MSICPKQEHLLMGHAMRGDRIKVTYSSGLQTVIWGGTRMFYLQGQNPDIDSRGRRCRRRYNARKGSLRKKVQGLPRGAKVEVLSYHYPLLEWLVVKSIKVKKSG